MTTIAAKIGTTDWNLIGIRSSQAGQKCDHCPRSLKNLYDVENRVTGQTMTVGRGCCKKVTGWTLTAAEAARLLRVAAIEARQAAVWAEFTAKHPDDAALLEADIVAWRTARPGRCNIPASVKNDIARGATPRSWWAGRMQEYRRTRLS
ncbi:hypothetical protein ABR737_01610 [Streptomyces sp. Edi2]|uniref:hypothetical protein n=1 Tax=Streptomyces sp. Edi2 TaxID=3162528 RepID=UPI0033056EE9